MTMNEFISKKLFVTVLVGIATFILAEQGKLDGYSTAIFTTIVGSFNVVQGIVDHRLAKNQEGSRSDS